VLGDRRSRFRGTSTRAYHEESANDRSDSSVSVRSIGRVPLTKEEKRKEENGRSASECACTRRRENPRNGSTQPSDDRFLARVTWWPSFARGEQIKRVATSPSRRRETAATLHARLVVAVVVVVVVVVVIIVIVFIITVVVVAIIVDEAVADRETVFFLPRKRVMDSLELPAGLRLVRVHRLTRRSDVAIRH